MPEERKSPKPPGRGGVSRHQGSEHHGWSPDVDDTQRQDNPSAHKSFHAEEHAPARGAGRKQSKAERTSVTGDVAKSDARRGEEQGDKSEKGTRDTGSRGRSGRPSGTKSDSAFTGIDSDDSSGRRRPG
jgi:hypothetical protein